MNAKNNAVKWLLICLLPVGAFAANELSTQDSTVFTKNNSIYQISLNNQQTITGTTAHDVTYKVPTNGVAIAFGMTLPVGQVTLYNTTTNAGRSISYGTNSTAYFGRLNPGEHAKFRPRDGGSNFWLQADAAALTLTNDVRVIAIPQ